MPFVNITVAFFMKGRTKYPLQVTVTRICSVLHKEIIIVRAKKATEVMASANKFPMHM